MTRGIRLAFGLVVAIATSAAAEPEDFSRIRVAAAKGDAAIAFLAPVLRYDYRVMISRYDPVTRTVGRGEVFRVSRQKATVKPGTSLALKVKVATPGEYVVRMITWQDHWAGCLSEATASFSVRPGEVALLGTLDPAPTIRSIESEAMRTGKGSASGGQVRVFKENIAPPLLIPAGADGVLEFAIAALPKVSAPLVAAASASASFVRQDKSDLFLHCA